MDERDHRGRAGDRVTGAGPGPVTRRERSDTAPGHGVGRLHHVIVDCADPVAESRFWSALLGQPVTYQDDDFAVVARDDTTSGLGFQRVAGHVPPAWPGTAGGQQLHLDVMVDDLDAAATAVVRLGARALGGDHVFADPAGHPFCLVRRPGWADPVSAAP